MTRPAARRRKATRLDSPPTWKGSFYRALFAAVLLFGLTRLGLGQGLTLGTSLALCAFSMLIYVPLGYATDGFVYRRRQKSKARG